MRGAQIWRVLKEGGSFTSLAPTARRGVLDMEILFLLMRVSDFIFCDRKLDYYGSYRKEFLESRTLLSTR
jgi:hypothetical protein